MKLKNQLVEYIHDCYFVAKRIPTLETLKLEIEIDENLINEIVEKNKFFIVNENILLFPLDQDWPIVSIKLLNHLEKFSSDVQNSDDTPEIRNQINEIDKFLKKKKDATMTKEDDPYRNLRKAIKSHESKDKSAS